MLNITTINSNIKDGAKYYTKEESYYSQNKEIQSMTQSEWFGDLAPRDPYSAERFTELFYGKLPGKERIRNEVKGKGQERLAYDLTFSVPGKSLSMSTHGPNGDRRLWDAHVEAIKEVMVIVEERYAAARIQANNDRQVIKTNNIAAALVHHHETRAGDPHVHTHVVLFNGTLCPDGEYRAMYIEPLIRSGILGDLYDQKMALKVQKLGYEIRETKTGFDLDGVTDEQIKKFSKRSTEIEDYLKEKGWANTPKNRQKATFETRIGKDITESLEQKQQRWGEEMASVGFTGITPSDQPIKPENQETPRELLNAAIEHLTEHQSSFNVEDIQRFVFSHLRSFDEKPLNAEIAKHPDLITAWDGRLTTQTAVDRDQRILDIVLSKDSKVEPLNPTADFSDTILNSGQAEAMRRLLSFSDQYQILKGLAGTGKTTALGLAREQLPPGIDIKVFAPTHNAKHQISEAFGLKGATIASFVVSPPPEGANQLWIFDEAGMIGSADMEKILQKAEQVGARCWFVGDTGQNASISAGAPVRMLMNKGATVHRLDQIIRQQNKEQLRAVELIADGHGVEALRALEKNGNIREVKDSETKLTSAVAYYMEKPKHRQDKTLVVVGTNAERFSFTKLLRAELIKEGQLTKNTEFTQLQRRNLSKAQKKRAENYNKGDLLVLHKKHRLYTQLQTHVPYEVLAVEGKKLKVQSPGGRHFTINPAEHELTQVYTKRRNQIAVGDKLRYTSTNMKKDIHSNAFLTCTDIKDQIATVKDKHGRVHHLDLTKPLQIDHDWATTTYRSQGSTNSETLYIASLNPTSAKESFYVGISRNKTKYLTVFTEDLSKLQEWVAQSNAQENALEILFDPHAGWSPTYDKEERPFGLDEDTWTEMKGSGIHPNLLTSNHLRSEAPDPYGSIRDNPLVAALLEAEFTKSKYGKGQEVTGKMKQYLHGASTVEGHTVYDHEKEYGRIAQGGGWIGYGGVDLLSVIEGNPQPSQYCQVKPKTPRIFDGKENKYETPKGVDQQVFLPHIPHEIEERIYQRNGISPTAEERTKGIWSVADKYNLPLVITEGLKKTWASLSQGHLTVGLPGVTALYRAKNEHDERLPQRELTEYGKALAKPGRQITLAFDQDTKVSSILNVRRDLVRTIELMQTRGVVCKIAQWKPELGKGLDDLIVKAGPKAYNLAIANAVRPDAEIKRHYRTQYNAITKRAIKRFGDIPKERLDMEVYSYCLSPDNGATINDAHRFLSASDHMRSAEPGDYKRYMLAIHKTHGIYQDILASGKPPNELVTKLVEHSVYEQLAEELKEKDLLYPEQTLSDNQSQGYSVGF
ncbi:MobF family relaxase [Acaryochloris marina]|uniref:MobF family relaxase n=1 Tax=Acaryochloris marina TaxID=155978 RepID=UPI0021C260A2|nr:MobF family relaxase [Acaryochloris marina]BDM82829.1 hypothetical protein AM10699_56900 [Acaryochloris marina MBIC10699]